jgi:hypothetical protein
MRRVSPTLILVLGATILALGMAVLGQVAPMSAVSSGPQGFHEGNRAPAPIVNRTEPVPIRLAEASPFVAGREVYTRPVIEPAPAPPPVRRDVVIELVGIVVENGERSVVVMLDGAERTLSLGDQTEAGRVAFIGLDSVRLEGEQTRTISLFD